MRRLLRSAVAVSLVCAWTGLAQTDAGSAASAPRVPELRQIDPVRDAAAWERIEVVRQKLPAEFRSRNNFAWAVAWIDGLEKREYFAHSRVQTLDGLSAEAAEPIADISLKPVQEKARFKVLCVNQNGAVDGDDCWWRDVDTECKILEDVAARLPDSAVAGHLRLYTELYPCPSCWNVMIQFLAMYSNVQMQVLYRTP